MYLFCSLFMTLEFFPTSSYYFLVPVRRDDQTPGPRVRTNIQDCNEPGHTPKISDIKLREVACLATIA
jgi:hypothetical protein